MASPAHLVEALAATIRIDKRSVEPLRFSVERGSLKWVVFARLLIFAFRSTTHILSDRCD